jgi:hypothetical protein
MKPIVTAVARVATRRPQSKSFTLLRNGSRHSSDAAGNTARENRAWFWRSVLGGAGFATAAAAGSAVARCDDSLIDVSAISWRGVAGCDNVAQHTTR